ncbi:MAG: ribonucleoside-diphosphate reductase subunit alpha [Pseudohongiellaceae bacterium]
MQTSTPTSSGTTPGSIAPITAEPVSPSATAPGQLRVIKRNGAVVAYDESKISVAITKAYLAVEGASGADSTRIHEAVEQLTEQITAIFRRRMPSGGTIHIEDIQDQVELALMRTGEHKIARSYVIYRAEHDRLRKSNESLQERKQATEITVSFADGSRGPLDAKRLRTVIDEACAGLDDVSAERIYEETLKNLYPGVQMSDVQTSLVMTARTMVELDPNYSYVTARLLLDSLRSETLGFLGVAGAATQAEMHQHYPVTLRAYIKKGIELGLLSPHLEEYDLEVLGRALQADRDQQFTYLGLQTLYDRYFIHHREVRFELPQIFFMRVAMGLASKEQDREARAIEFYDLISSFDYMTSTPQLFNSGTLQPQLSSCFLTTVPDHLDGIYSAIKDNAMLSKWAGGLGNDWTPVRAMGAHIKGTNGKSQGVVPFLKVVNDTAVAVNQGGKRKGAVCSYLETWHLDIEEFLELRKNTGDDRRRTHDMNTANWVPDLFMKRVFNNQDWTLFSPSNVPDLHEKHGKEFEAAYEEYERRAVAGEMEIYKTVKAADLWRKMLSMLFETGHPWITFKDSCNVRSPQQHTGTIHSSNLCTEITLNTNAEEIAVCNLGSINMVNHVDGRGGANGGANGSESSSKSGNEHGSKGGINHEKLQRTIRTAVRMLDNVIDINYYSVPQAKNSNMQHRPIGMGIMGFQDALYKLRMPYASDEAVEFADESMEAISYYAIQASSELAEERGRYESYSGSLWDRGILPIDSLQLLARQRGEGYLEVNHDQRLDWDGLRKRIKQTGMRNSNVMAIAPTATIANITGVSQSIEPTYQNLFVKSNLSGEFTVVNPYLVNDLKAHNLWDGVMVNDLKYFEGSIKKIDRVPDDIKHLYATAFEIEPRWLVDAASRRQKWIDQAQSLNLYIAGASGKKLDITYRMAWLRGLKTTYYLRALAATTTEKSTVADNKLNKVSTEEPSAVPVACSIDDPDCEACQ